MDILYLIFLQYLHYHFSKKHKISYQILLVHFVIIIQDGVISEYIATKSNSANVTNADNIQNSKYWQKVPYIMHFITNYVITMNLSYSVNSFTTLFLFHLRCVFEKTVTSPNSFLALTISVVLWMVVPTTST